MRPEADYFRQNNFDLLRLVAATQVALLHGMDHLGVPHNPLTQVLAWLPGVPAFFFISGFLISASWERNPDVRNFFLNRALRIFPGLWAATALGAITVVAFAATVDLSAHLPGFLLWLVTQSTVFQAWNPGFLRPYGVGVVNGSLWTIAVELSFYCFVPLFYGLVRRERHRDGALALVMAASFALQFWLVDYRLAAGDTLLYKVLHVSPLPWVGMFCSGVLAQRHVATLAPRVAGRLGACLALFAAVSLAAAVAPLDPLLRGASNSMGLLNYLAMIALLLAAAFTRRDLADRLLRRNDVSYGMYVFHMPVVNVLVQARLGGWPALAAALAVTAGLALLSWRCLERPALRLRHAALFQR